MTVLAIVQCWNKEDPARGFTVGWIEALAAEAGHVIVLALEKRHASTDPRIEVFSLGKESYTGPFRFIYYLFNWHRMMWKIGKERRPDFIFTHMTPLYSVLAYPYARYLRTPIITWFSHPRGSWMLRLAHAASYRVVSVSRDSYPYPDAKLIPVGHGIDTDFFTPLVHVRKSPPLIISVGRITPIKNIEMLLHAVRFIKGETPFKVVIIGSPFTFADEAHATSLQKRVIDMGLEGFVSFVPAVSRDELRDWYRRATLHVNCTEAGSCDKVILESMACGTPCVAVSSVFSHVFDIYTSLLVAAPAGAEELARRMRSILMMPTHEYDALCVAMCVEAKKSYSLRVFCRKMVHAFHAVRTG